MGMYPRQSSCLGYSVCGGYAVSKLKSNEYMLSDGCGGVLCLWLPPPLYIYIYIYTCQGQKRISYWTVPHRLLQI